MKANTDGLYSRSYARSQGVVICRNPISGRIYVRKYVATPQHRGNVMLKSISINLRKLKPSLGFVSDLTAYLTALKTQKTHVEGAPVNWYSLYLKLMYAMARRNKDVDLATLTREQIVSRDLPCRTVRKAVEAGLLPWVKGHEELVQEM